MSATIDIVILNYNTRGLLERLLPTVISCSQGEGINIVVADNASSDGSAEMVSAKFPDVELIEMSENRGYAGGYNACLAGRTADYFVLLNSDAEPAPGWLLPLLKMAEENPSLGAAQPHLMDYYNRNKFEYAGAGGGFMDQYGYPFCRGRIFGNVEQNEGQYDDGLQVFLCLVGQFGEAAVVRAVGRDLICREPAGIHVLEEIVLRADGGVEAFGIHA